ncbi:hypothetical protein D3C85_1277830 [compost metagenome]
MKERQFAGMLNSRSRYGVDWGNNQSIRFKKYCRLQEICIPHSGLWLKWNKRSKFIYPSWGESLWSYAGEITWTQRQENKGRKVKKFEMFRWKSK